VACVQEIRWRGSGCRFFGAIGKKYKLYWMRSKAKTDGVGIFVAEKWVDSVVSVERHSERVLVLKMVLGRDRGIMRLCARRISRIIGDISHNWANPA